MIATGTDLKPVEIVFFIKVYNLTKRGVLDFNINPTFVSTHTHAKLLRRSITRPNDVLMNIVGPPLGKVSLVPDDYPEWNINQPQSLKVLLNS